MRLAASLLLLASLAWAQQAQRIAIDHFGGLNDSDSSAVIPDHESQDMLNVESNLQGTAIIKRHGYSQLAALTVSTAQVNGSFFFRDNSGNEHIIVCQNVYCANSTNGGAFSNFLTTATATTTRWSFVAADGAVYGANDSHDKVFKYDGTNLTYPANIPQGTLLELTRDRLAVADTTANPGTVNYSKAGDFTTFAIGVNSADPWTDQIETAGDRLTGMKYDQGTLYFFKFHSITACDVKDQYSTICAPVSSQIGTQDPTSIISAPDGLYFMGSDNNVWLLVNGTLTKASLQIPNLLASRPSGKTFNNSQDSQSDWGAGSQSPSGSWDSGTISGSIFPSSTTLLDTTAIDFASGTLVNLSTGRVSGALTLEVSTSSGTSQTLDSFTDLNYTANPAWTVQAANWAVTGAAKLTGYFTGGSLPTIYTAQTESTGTFEAKETLGVNSVSVVFKFISDGALLSTSNGYRLIVTRNDGANQIQMELDRVASGGPTTVCTANRTPSDGSEHTYTITRTSAGAFTVYLDGVSQCSGTDATYSTSSFLFFEVTQQATASGNVLIDDVKTPGYLSSGSIVSRIFDTAYSTPTWGIFQATATIPTSTTLTYQVQASTANDGGGFEALVSQATDGKIGAATKRYIRYKASFTTSVSSSTPELDNVSLLAATTGQYTSQCIQTTNANTFGLFSCAQTLVGNGSLSYGTRSAATCGALSGAFTAQTNNANISAAANSALQFQVTSLLGSATDQAQLDACTVYWNTGALPPPVWSAYDSSKNALYWTYTVAPSSTTNRLIKYDLNNHEWFPWSLSANAPLVANDMLYFGSSQAGFWYQYGAVDNDTGTAITAYWKSKDFGGDDPFVSRLWTAASVILKNQGSGTLTSTWTNGRAATGSYTVSMGTTTGVNYIRSNVYLPVKSPETFLNLKVSNSNANEPFEVNGIGLYYQDQPWKVYAP